MKEPETHATLQAMVTLGLAGHLVTWLYLVIMEMTSHPFPRLQERWKGTLNRQLTEKEWKKVLGGPKKVSRITAFKFLQFNMLHRTYLTPHRLNAVYGGEDQACARCSQRDADFDHMVWSCPGLKDYWTKIEDMVNGVLSQNLACIPEICLLGLFPRPKSKRLGLRFIDLALLLARRRIALKWKAKQAPLVVKWEDDVSCWARAEERALIKEDKITKWHKPHTPTH